ncbi:hypothetical protein [Actinomyces radicidentis]|uniref:hypothetical protein n=1 Tax=Actinomyces radicidentis TaxID=111015 RepID=UPI0026E0D714|nr:hypothetical protein [Actinomyces radicidentis]
MPDTLNAAAGTSADADSTQVAANRARKRRGRWRALVCCALLAVTCWAAALTLPVSSERHDFLVGVAAGAGVMTLAFGVVLLLGLRGRDGALPRMMTGEIDERDKAVWLRAWQATGMAAFAGVLLGEVAIVLGAPAQAPLAILSFVLVIVLYGSHAVIDRRM